MVEVGDRLKRETRNSVVAGRFEFVRDADALPTSMPPRATSLWRGDTRTGRPCRFRYARLRAYLPSLTRTSKPARWTRSAHIPPYARPTAYCLRSRRNHFASSSSAARLPLHRAAPYLRRPKPRREVTPSSTHRVDCAHAFTRQKEGRRLSASLQAAQRQEEERKLQRSSYRTEAGARA